MSVVPLRADTFGGEETCPWCGDPRSLELFEVWEHGHEFMLDTCCGAALEEVCAGIAEDPVWGRDLLRRLDAEACAGHRLRRVADDGAGALLLDYRLRIRPVAFAVARAFVARHHLHCGPPVAWRFGFGIANCSGSHWCAPRPAMLGHFRPAFGDPVRGFRLTLSAPEPA